MRYPVIIEGFEGQKIEVESSGLVTGPKLLVNGQPAAKGPKRGQFTLRRNDGREAVASWKAGLSNLTGVPRLAVDDEIIDVIDPPPWYQLVWSALPFILIVLGGFLGAIIGFMAFSINNLVFRSNQSQVLKYVITGAINVAAFIFYLVVAILVASMIG